MNKSSREACLLPHLLDKDVDHRKQMDYRSKFDYSDPGGQLIFLFDLLSSKQWYPFLLGVKKKNNPSQISTLLHHRTLENFLRQRWLGDFHISTSFSNVRDICRVGHLQAYQNETQNNGKYFFHLPLIASTVPTECSKNRG